jgi:pyrroloquinoline quinone (PQQ) biosynthesis protein C
MTMGITVRPYSKADLRNPEVLLNLHYLAMLEDEARRQPAFDHPFLIRVAKGNCSERAIRFTLIQYSKHLGAFASGLAHLVSMAPDARDRLMLLGQHSEERSRGAVVGASYQLYLDLLGSMGVSLEEIERTRTLTSIELLNEWLAQAVRRSFISGLVWFGLGGELTIPNNLAYLAVGAKAAFPGLDPAFFEHHAEERDRERNFLLAMKLKGQADRDLVRSEALKSLFLRAAVWDEIATLAERQ